MALRMDIVEDPAALAGLAAGWIALSAADAATPFQTFQWHLAWWELVGLNEPDARPHLVTFDDGDRLCGLAPLAVWQSGGEPVLRFSSDPWADYHDVLVDRERTSPEAVYDCLLEHLRRGLADGRWARVELRELPAWSALGNFLAKVVEAVAASRLQPGSVCLRAGLADAEGFKRAVSKKEYAVKQRRLERLGQLECRHHAHPQHVAERMPEFMAMHLRQWMDRPDGGLTFDRADMVRFYQGCVPLLGAAGLLLSELLLDERPIGYYFGFLHRRTFWGYRTTFDTGLKQLSPGGVMHRMMFRFLREHGCDTFDFMRVDQPYKRRYASVLCQNRDLLWQAAEMDHEEHPAAPEASFP